jgi:ATP-dependent helicase HrpA
MIREKVTHYLKALPKTVRNRVIPISEFVTAFLESAHAQETPLPDALRGYLQQRLAQPLPDDLWGDAELPLHLQLNIAVVDDAGQELASGRELAALRAKLSDAAQLARRCRSGLERKGLRQWDFGDLPESLTFTRDSRRITAYPALVDEDNAVSLALFDAPDAADAATRAGVVRLLRIALRDALTRYDKGGTGFAQAALQLKAAMPTDRLLADVLAAALTRAFLSDDPLPRTERAFADQVKRARARLPAVMEGAFRLLTAVANEHQAVTQRIVTAGGGGGPSAARGPPSAMRCVSGFSRPRPGRSWSICRGI